MELTQFATFEENCVQDSRDIEFQTEAQFSFDKEQSILCSIIIANLYVADKPLIKAELKSYFNIDPESIKDLTRDGKITFYPMALTQFASLCYGSLRGVLFAKTMNTPLSNCILPPVFFGNVINKGFTIED